MKHQLIRMLCLFVLSAPAFADPLLNYQGRLVGTNGAPFQGVVDVVLNVYNAETGGDPVYFEELGGVMVQDGLYSFNWGSAGTVAVEQREQVATANGSESSFSFQTTYSPVQPGSVTIAAGDYSWSDDGRGSSHPAQFTGSVENATSGAMTAEFLSGNAAEGTPIMVTYRSLEATRFSPGTGSQYLEVVLDGEPLSPRALMTAVPMALKAQQADAATTATTADSADYATTAGNANQLGGLNADQYALDANVQVDLRELYGALNLAYPTIEEPDVTNLYLVIDLSAGPDATTYPVTGLDAVPAGGWTDEYKTTKLVMRRIPAGSFTMGSPSNELGRSLIETQHSVTLTEDFYVGVFEVTQKQWERVMGDWPSFFTNISFRETRPVEQVSYNDILRTPGQTNEVPAGWPVTRTVDRFSFMGKLREKTGLTTLNLPTESQWEYACRAGTTTALNSGKDLQNVPGENPPLSEVARYLSNNDGNQPDAGTSGGTASVGSYLENNWGLYDMHGNVYELCLDWFGLYPTPVATDPVGAASGSNRVIRGGSWKVTADRCRSASRAELEPVFRSNATGFRLARPVP